MAQGPRSSSSRPAVAFSVLNTQFSLSPFFAFCILRCLCALSAPCVVTSSPIIISGYRAQQLRVLRRQTDNAMLQFPPSFSHLDDCFICQLLPTVLRFYGTGSGSGIGGELCRDRAVTGLIYIADAVDFSHNRRLHVGSQETVQLPLFLSRQRERERAGSKGLRGQRSNCPAVHDVARL